MRWEVYRCDLADQDDAHDRACGIREVSADLGTNGMGRMIVSDTNREECCHHMLLTDAQEIVDSHNLIPDWNDEGAEFRCRTCGNTVVVTGVNCSECKAPDRDARQKTIGDWTVRCFGEPEALSIPQRALRVLEEAIELAQASNVPEIMAAKLISFVYDREPGDIQQELGGVGCTLLAFGAAALLSVDTCEENEVERVLSKPPEHFAERNKLKNAAGFKVT